MVQQYSFPQIAIEIMLTLSSGGKSPERMVKLTGRAMLSILKSLEELMSDNFIYKLPDSSFEPTKQGRTFIEDLNSGMAFVAFTPEGIYDSRW